MKTYESDWDRMFLQFAGVETTTLIKVEVVKVVEVVLCQKGQEIFSNTRYF